MVGDKSVGCLNYIQGDRDLHGMKYRLERYALRDT